MSRNKLASFEDLWERHQDLYQEVFVKALNELKRQSSLKGDEDNISKNLASILNEVCFKLGQTRNIEIKTPNWESPIQPGSQGSLSNPDIGKRPDFTCKLVNGRAQTADTHEISLHVECKILGKNSSSSWVYNENYVKRGIARYDNRSHQYGRNAPSGFMIGYIINMDLSDIEIEVNGNITKHLPHFPCLNFPFKKKSLDKTDQDISRQVVNPCDFCLTHFWIDIRDIYQQ